MSLKGKKNRKPYEGMEPRRMGDPLPIEQYEHKIVDGMKVPITPPQAFPTPEEKTEVESEWGRLATESRQFGESRLTPEQLALKRRYSGELTKITDFEDRANIIASDINRRWKNDLSLMYKDNIWRDSYWSPKIVEEHPKGDYVIIEYTLHGPLPDTTFKMRELLAQMFNRDRNFVPRAEKVDSQGRMVKVVKMFRKRSRWD